MMYQRAIIISFPKNSLKGLFLAFGEREQSLYDCGKYRVDA